jgi:type IV pilus assembly protein PilE
MAQANLSRADDAGFTLVEAVVALAIAAVVAAVAYPSYTAQVRKSRRADAVVALMQVEQAQERWRGAHPDYAAELAAPQGLGLSAASAGGYYAVALSDAGASGYVVTATAVPGRSQSADGDCTTLVVTVRHGNALRTPPQCWSR